MDSLDGILDRFCPNSTLDKMLQYQFAKMSSVDENNQNIRITLGLL